MVVSKNHLKASVDRLKNKSFNTNATFKVTAVAYSNKGDILGYATNNIRMDIVPSHRGAGVHAERELVKKYGKKIKYIVLARFGGSGDLLPIDPCENCQKILDEFGIKVIKLRDIISK